LGWAAEAQDHLDEAQTWFERELPIDRELGGDGASTMGKLAEILQYKGDLSGATRRTEQVLAIAKESGNMLLESNALNNLVELYIRQGELATARELTAQADAILAKTNEKRGIATAIGHWGDILMAENNIAGARQKYEESLRILTQTNEMQSYPYRQMSLAELEIEQGRTSEAEALLTQVINYFHSQRNSPDEGWAMGIYARAELESGNITSALQKAKLAKALCAHDQTLSSLGVRLFAARVDGLTGNRKAAEVELKSLLKVAERQGNVQLAFDARFALGEIAFKSQDPSGRKILNDLSRDAASKGFLLLSRKASNLAESTNLSQH
jgi:tetratricopeptide (TPR) repeat protein